MKRSLNCHFLIAVLWLCSVSCYCTGPQSERRAGVAGSFYPADAGELTTFVDREMSRANVPKIDGAILGLVAPHAGYPYSGSIAAHSYALLKGRKYKRVVLIGPSHFEAFGYTSVYDGQAYTTPLGKVMVDKEFAGKLAAQSRSLKLSSAGHALREQSEHSLEVQLPFLQRALGEFQLVPVVMGNRSYQSSRELGMALAKLLRNDTDTLLVASSDLSHFHTYEEAVRMDSSLLNGIAQNDFLTVSRNLEASVWEACGGAPIVAVMIAAQHLGAAAPRRIQYANSGDVTGDKGRVVGYASLVFAREAGGPQADKLTLSAAEREELLRIARSSVETAVRERKRFEPPAPGSGILRQERGAFVTLTKKGELRGCIGYVTPIYPLYLAVQEAATHAALRDPRFPAVRPEELGDLQYEISVISPFLHVLDTKTVRVGEHGLLIRQDGVEGVLLPQVPVEQRWDRGTFLEQVSLKAGLPRDAWQDPGADLFTFTALVFSDHETTATKK